MKFYQLVETNDYMELALAVDGLIAGDASWQPLGGPFVRGMNWFQAVYRRPSIWKRLGIFARRVGRGIRSIFKKKMP